MSQGQKPEKPQKPHKKNRLGQRARKQQALLAGRPQTVRHPTACKQFCMNPVHLSAQEIHAGSGLWVIS